MFNPQDIAQIRGLIKQETADLSQYLRIDGGRKYQGHELDLNEALLNNVANFKPGTYTPILRETANLDSSVAYEAQWIQLANMVLVFGAFTANPTTTATATTLGLSLPVASNFSDAAQLGGTASAQASSGDHAAIKADATNNEATVQWDCIGTANLSMVFFLGYQIR